MIEKYRAYELADNPVSEQKGLDSRKKAKVINWVYGVLLGKKLLAKYVNAPELILRALQHAKKVWYIRTVR